MFKLRKAAGAALAILVIISALIAVPTSASAKSEFSYKKLSDGTICITDYSGTDTDLVIPSKIDGYKVTEFYVDDTDNWDECYDVKSIVFADTIKKINISPYVFDRVQSVTLPKNMKNISANMFEDFDDLKKVVLPENLRKIGDYAFAYTRLKNIKIPDSVTYIGKRAFSSCEFEKLTLPKRLQRIGVEAFKYSGIKGTLVIPDTVRTIGRSAFAGNDFTTVEIGKKTKSISAKAFIDNSSHREFKVSEDNKYYTAVDGVLYTKDMKTLVRFPQAKKGDVYTVPDSVEQIGGCGFAYSGLKKVILGSNIKNIANKSFKFSRSLESVNLPEGLLRIGMDAFKCCENLKEIDVPENITKIYEGTFSNCKNLSRAKLPSNLLVIESEAFYNCRNLTELEIPETIQRIESCAFAYSGIANLTLPNLPDKYLQDSVREMYNLSELNLLNPDANFRMFRRYYWWNDEELIKINLADKQVAMTAGTSDELDSNIFAVFEDAEITVSDTSVLKAEIVDDAYIAVDALCAGTSTITLSNGFITQSFVVTVEEAEE